MLTILFKIKIFKMCVIGIDPSINSTGVCVATGKKDIYYIITPKMTKKMKEFDNKYIKYLPYEKKQYTDMEYHEKEVIKTDNFKNILSQLEYIIKKHKPDTCVMEGVSYGSVKGSALIDLSGLNYLIRMLLNKYNIQFTIVPPTSLKKFVCGNGQADKELMVHTWKKMDKNIQNITDIKIDDLADAYFMAHYTA